MTEKNLFEIPSKIYDCGEIEKDEKLKKDIVKDGYFTCSVQVQGSFQRYIFILRNTMLRNEVLRNTGDDVT